MTRGRADGGQSKKLVPILLIVVVVGLIYLYSRSHGTSPVELGGRSLIKLGSSLGGEEEADSSTPAEDEENDFMLKSIPVSNLPDHLSFPYLLHFHFWQMVVIICKLRMPVC